MHTYVCMYIHECSTFVCTVLLSLSRIVYTYVHKYILVYMCKDCTHIYGPQFNIQNLTYINLCKKICTD